MAPRLLHESRATPDVWLVTDLVPEARLPVSAPDPRAVTA